MAEAQRSPDPEPLWLYAIALGSNRRHGRHGAPRRVLTAAVAAIEDAGLEPFAASAAIDSAAIGPSQRRFANAVLLIATAASPPRLLAMVKRIERDFGRRPGQRWGARVLDLDIILWSGGTWRGPGLTVPHPGWMARDFVAGPLAGIAGDWRVPATGLRVRHVAARLTKAAASR